MRIEKVNGVIREIVEMNGSRTCEFQKIFRKYTLTNHRGIGMKPLKARDSKNKSV